jgi:multidrug efflux pump subunit AcrB
MDEVSRPIIAIGLVLCAVFVPVAFLSGLTGSSTGSSRSRLPSPP